MCPQAMISNVAKYQWDVGLETEKNGLITSVEPPPSPPPPPIIEHIDMRGYRKTNLSL